jgi:hypothetical protein
MALNIKGILGLGRPRPSEMRQKRNITSAPTAIPTSAMPTSTRNYDSARETTNHVPPTPAKQNPAQERRPSTSAEIVQKMLRKLNVI